MSTYLVTGATGFVGGHLCTYLLDHGHSVVAAVRTPGSIEDKRITEKPVGDLTEAFWPPALEGVDYVIHLAARVHVMNETAADPLTEFRKVNTEATANLGRACADAGVKRMVFASSVKVNGEWTTGLPFCEADQPQPKDPYGVSKWEAEQALLSTPGLSVTTVRPTLIYGPGVGANFLALMKWVNTGKPLPLGGVKNKRSFTGITNFCSFLTTCSTHDAAAGETFMISDGEDISTPELIRKMAAILNKPARLLPVPEGLINFLGAAVGKKEYARRLTGSLQVDSSKARYLLGWQPERSFDEELRRTVEWFRDTDAW